MNPKTKGTTKPFVALSRRSECRRWTPQKPSRAPALRRLLHGAALRASRSADPGTSARSAAALFAICMLLAFPAALRSRPREQRVVLNSAINRPAIENLQRWVSGGHQSWCRDARMVASAELRRIAPDFVAGTDLRAMPLQTEFLAGTKAVFTWTPLDGRATYRVTVERFAWLLPLAGARERIVWVPTSTEIVAHP